MNQIIMTQEPLEKTVEKEEKNTRKAIADKTAAITFSWPTGAAYELLWLGMTGWQCLKSRIFMTGVNAATGDWFGSWSDYLYRKFKVPKQSVSAKRFLTDILACGSFYTPLYTGMIYLLTQDTEKTKEALETSAVFGAATAIPLRSYMTLVRQWFGVKPEYLDNKVEA